MLRTAGAPAALRLTADRSKTGAGGLVFVTAEVTDARAVTVPGAAPALTFGVRGGRLLGADSGQQESAENYTSPTRAAFHGLALAIVRVDRGAGALTVTARAAGLRSGSVTVPVDGTRQAATSAVPTVARDGVAGHGASATAAEQADPASAGVSGPVAGAGFSGAAGSIPAAMLDGDPAPGWSNAYTMAPTALLPETSRAHATEWVSLTWPGRTRLTGAEAVFTVDGSPDLPESIEVSHWNGAPRTCPWTTSTSPGRPSPAGPPGSPSTRSPPPRSAST